MRVRITPAQFLAVQNARISSAQDAPMEARQTALVLEAIDRILASVRARAGHIGQVNEWLTHLVEQDIVALLPPEEQDELTSLLVQGGLLAFDDTGFGGGLY